MLFTLLTAIDQLELITTMGGEFSGSEFGNSIVSMDFNGDGYDDLIVKSQGWNPNGVFNQLQRYGKLYFYWGGPNFDNMADFTIEGQYPYHFGGEYGGFQMYNGGDINADGIDDLIIPFETIEGYKVVSVFYGNNTPNSIPDASYCFPPNYTALQIFPLGDINGDEHFDIAILTETSFPNSSSIFIWDNTNNDPWTFHENGYTSGMPVLNRIGDVNNDGIDDCLLQAPYATYENSRYTLFEGNLNFPETDSIVVCENAPNSPSMFASSIGDYNGDGIDDFVAYNGRLWLGSPTINATHNLRLNYNSHLHEWGTLEHNGGNPLVYGDLNGDGKDDIVGSDTVINGHSGQVGIWVGTNNSYLNGDIDLFIWPPSNYIYRNFGWAKATGDFNGDGLCDLALSAPWYFEGQPSLTNGKVFIYSGNTQLQDTAVGVEDEFIPCPNQDDWSFDIYPSPSKTRDFKLNLLGASYKRVNQLEVQVYNLKGQHVFSRSYSRNPKNRSELSLQLPGNLSSGIFCISLESQGKKLITKKLILY